MSQNLIDWQQIDTVFLDMDGTLLDLNFDNHFWTQYVPEQYANKTGTTVSAARESLMTQMRSVQGSLKWYCIDYWSQQLDLNIAELKQDMAHLIGFRPGAEAFLQQLKRASKRVVLATNAHPKTLSIKFAKANLQPWMDEIITSHDLAYPKEAIEFWHCLQKQSPFDPKRSLFIDDNIPILGTAKQYGIQHLLTIRKPDLSGPDKADQGFFSLTHFDQISLT